MEGSMECLALSKYKGEDDMYQVFRNKDEKAIPGPYGYIWYHGNGSQSGDSKRMSESGDYEFIGYAESEQGCEDMTDADMEGRGI
jgi:hypothetical protein